MIVYNKLKVFPPVLKALRKEAGYTQQDLALRLGVSRETVVAIEGAKRSSIDSLQLALLYKWWSVCKIKATLNTVDKFTQLFKDLLDI